MVSSSHWPGLIIIATAKKLVKTATVQKPPPTYHPAAATPEPPVAPPFDELQHTAEAAEQDVVYPLEYNCFCGKPDNLKMIQCDNCDAWYHYACQRLSEEQVELMGDAAFYCLRCESKMKAETHSKQMAAAAAAAPVYKPTQKYQKPAQPAPPPPFMPKAAPQKPPLFTYRKDPKTGQLMKIKPAVATPPQQHLHTHPSPLGAPPPVHTPAVKPQQSVRPPRLDMAPLLDDYYQDVPQSSAVDPLDLLLTEMDK